MREAPVHSSRTSVTGPAAGRFELKYTIPADRIDSIVEFLSPYCIFDAYSAAVADGFYVVNSLYFDTPAYYFLRQRIMRAENRFNMRIRTYGARPEMPYFLEVKQRTGDLVRKFRGKIFDANPGAALRENLRLPHADADGPDNEGNGNLFRRIAHRYNASPVVLVQYLRKALVSVCDEYARVTFDLGLRYAERRSYDPLPVEEDMIPCDAPACFDDGCSVVLELKCHASHVPLWMIDLVKQFHLTRRGFSKYANCLRPMLERNGTGREFARVPALTRNRGGQ